MEATEHDSGVLLDEVEQRIWEAVKEDASNIPVRDRLGLWVRRSQVQTDLNCQPESAGDLETTLPIPTLGFGEILFRFRREPNVHSSRSSLARTSSQVLRRGR